MISGTILAPSSSSDDDLINLGAHVLDQEDLVRHLGAAEDREHGLLGRGEHLAEVVELLGHKEAGALDVVVLADHRALADHRVWY